MIKRSEILYIGSATADNRDPKHIPLLSITTEPSAPFSKNSKYYNSTDKLIYSAKQNDTWDNAKTYPPVFGTIYEFYDGNTTKYYIWDGDNMVETDLEKYELLANKVNDVDANKTSTVKYPTVKSVYDFVKNQGIARNFDEVGITKTTHNDTILELAREIQGKRLTTGTILFGEIRNSDMPFNGNAEVRVEILETKGSPNYYQVIEFTLYSTNVAPNEWKYLYYGAEHTNPNDDTNPITWIPSLKPTDSYNTNSVNTYPSSKALYDGLALKQNNLDNTNVLTTGHGNVIDGISANNGVITATKNTTLSTVAITGDYNDLIGKPVWTLNNYTGNTGTTLNTQLTLNNPLIFRNGILLTATTDYTISGSVITFTDALVATDIIKVVDNISFSSVSNGGGVIRVLNIITTGTLTRSGASYSDFSGSNYLTLADRANGGYLSLDNTVKNFGSAVSTADNWEMVWKIKPTQSGDNVIFSENANYASNLYTSMIDGATKFSFYVSNSESGLGAFDIHTTTSLTINEFIFVKVEFTGTTYNIYLSSDGINWTLDATYSSSTKITRNSNWFVGRAQNTSYYMHGQIDLSGCYIKINGDIWWKGIEVISF